MIRAGRLDSRDCGGLTRRGLLHIGGLGALQVSLADLLRARSLAQNEPEPKARSVILLWLWGGPSQIDGFDPKPEAPLEYRGPYAPIATSIPGVSICEMLPQLAQRSSQYAIVRSMHHESNDHGIAGTINLTGSIKGARSLGGQILPGDVLPTHGAIVSRIHGFHPQIPLFVTVGKKLHQGKQFITGDEGGTFGPIHDPFRVDYIPGTGVQLPNLELQDGMTADGLSHRQKLLEQLDRLSRLGERSASIQRLDSFYQQAFSMLTSTDARRVFDIEQERIELRNRYGKHRFGQCCLFARRLIEAGVGFVQVNWSAHVEPVEDGGDGGWDMHDRYFQQFQDRHSWMLDNALSALLDDLQDRGMLDETIVVAIGEFGRTPKINAKAGRDHWNQCYSALVAGGGFQVGQVIGASDAQAEYPASRPTTPADLFTTVLNQIGIGTTRLTEINMLPLGELVEDLI